MEPYRYKYIAVYVNSNNMLYVVPCGINKKHNIVVGVDLLLVLHPPFTDQELVEFLFVAMDKCFTKTRDDLNCPGPLEKHFGKKSYDKAVKGLKLVKFYWVESEGYSFIGTEKQKKGYRPMEKIILGDEPEPQNVSEAFWRALNESTLSIYD